MIDLFELAKNDQSVYYLGRIFGIVGSVIPASNFPAGEAPPIILSEMFGVINGVALTIGVLVITYTTVVGLFATAAEGEFLGKKWSGIWVPIRTVIGIAGLFPSSGGYCAIQVFLMWFILQGVSAADMVWSKALDVINVYGNPKSGVSTPGTNDVETKMQSLFAGLVCQETALRKDAPIEMLAGPVGGGSSEPKKSIEYFCYGKTGVAFCDPGRDIYSMTPGGPQFYRPASEAESNYLQYNFGPGATANASDGGACGYVQYSNPTKICNDPNASQLACSSAKAQVVALNDIIRNTLGPIANKYAELDNQFIRFYETPAPTEDTASPKPASWILQYCMAPEGASPAGLGLQASQCCAYGETCGAYKFFETNSDLYDRKGGYAGMTSTSGKALTSIYKNFGMPTITSTDFIKTATDQYTKMVYTDPMKEYMENKPKKDWIKEATDLGWLMAGGYYMQIAKEKKTQNAAADPFFQTKINDPIKEPMKAYQRNNLVSANLLVQNIADENEPSSQYTQFSISSSSDSAFKEGGRKTNSIIQKFITNLTKKGEGINPGDDPIASIAQSGYEMMKSAEALFVTLSVAASVGAAAASLSPIVLGNGLPTSFFGAAFTMMMRFLGPLMILMISTIFTVGALLGVYVPLIPYIIFTVTAIGWFIAVIEAMTAAPFIALGIMSPGGQHELLSRAEPSLMILFNLFLRPTLMVLGMIAAMLLSWAIVTMINAAFANVMYQIMYAPGLIEQIVFMVAYTILIITALNKCYSIIHMLPERTLTYIGGHAIQFGEEQALQAVKGGVEAAGSAMAKGGRAGAVAAMKSEPREKETNISAQENQGGPSPPAGGGGNTTT